MKDLNEIIKILQMPLNKRSTSEFIVKVQKKTNKCQMCGKYYRFPHYVFKPRNLICNTCENQIVLDLTFKNIFN